MRLNLGAGAMRLHGYTSVDVQGADIVHDLSVYPWPFESESVLEIVASHILEHFDKAGGGLFVRECHRILKYGGTLRLAVPDLDKFIACINDGDWSRIGGYAHRDLNNLLGGGAAEPNPFMRHKYMYTYESLRMILLDCGFTGVMRVSFSDGLDNPQHQAFSLYVQAFK